MAFDRCLSLRLHCSGHAVSESWKSTWWEESCLSWRREAHRGCLGYLRGTPTPAPDYGLLAPQLSGLFLGPLGLLEAARRMLLLDTFETSKVSEGVSKKSPCPQRKLLRRVNLGPSSGVHALATGGLEVLGACWLLPFRPLLSPPHSLFSEVTEMPAPWDGSSGSPVGSPLGRRTRQRRQDRETEREGEGQTQRETSRPVTALGAEQRGGQWQQALPPGGRPRTASAPQPPSAHVHGPAPLVPQKRPQHAWC